MASRKGGLGKGLDSLIPDKKPQTTKKKITENQDGPVKVSINKVEPNREQPRKQFNEASLEELAESIQQHGIISPLLVQERDGYYEIIAGERRWRAARLAGLKEVPVIIRKFSEQEIVEISLIENIQREDLNPIEEAMAYQRLLDEFHLKQDEVAKRVSKSRTAVTNSIRLLKLDKRVQQMLANEEISAGHARAILGLEDPEQQYQLACRVRDENMSVRDVEREIKKLRSNKKTTTKKNPLTPQVEEQYHLLENHLKDYFGTKVQIRPKDNQRGTLEIHYYSQEELERITDLMRHK